LPVLYDAALRHPLVHRLEHLSLVAVGALVWTLVVDPAGHGRLSVNGRIGLAALMLWTGQMLAYVFVFSFHPYYDVYVEQPERLFGLSPLMDQKLAGVVMMVEQAVTLGTALVLLLLAARRSRTDAAPRVTPEPV
jgi:cytochrome c oxidase assembly factor CtaG